jgi:ATP-dependent helicase/nuclease subunit A
LLHALLQRLPDLAPETREAAALRMLARLAATHGLEATDIAGQPAKWAAGLAREAAGVLALPEMARLLAGASRAEAGLMGRIVFNGAPRMVTGVVDRIVETDACVTLVDYKTGRAPSGGPDPAHVAQLALYGLLAQPIWQGKRIEAALVYSGGPMVVRLEEAMLRAACARLGASPG